jgi:hypothetical protein
MPTTNPIPAPPEVIELDEEASELQHQLNEVAFIRRWAYTGLGVFTAFEAAMIALVILGYEFAIPFIIYPLIFIGAPLGAYTIIELRDKDLAIKREIDRISQRRRDALAGRFKRSAAPYARYKEHLPSLVDNYRLRAGKYRRVSTILQLVTIVGSLSVSAITAGFGGGDRGRLVAIFVSLLVGVSASVAISFRPRERADSLQHTADDIEREYRASELQIGAYTDIQDERTRLRTLAERVEELRSQQSTNERQLDQPPDLNRTSIDAPTT